MTIAHKSLPRAKTPEEAGVSSQGIRDFLVAMDATGLELHSFMVLRRGIVAAECFRAPFQPEYRHQMWSVSKSFTSTALGFAVDEGLVSLDTPVADILEGYIPKKADARWPKLTLRHLVTMTAGKQPSFLSPKGPNADWVQGYIDAPWYNEPGAEFRYINENTYMICAALTRAAGMSVMDYLAPRLFGPLGIADSMWETDNRGIECGGWGYYCKTEDLAKFILCYLNEGKFGGQQVIPAAWARGAVRKHADSNLFGVCHTYGYGMGFWRNAEGVGGWRAHGAFSQYGVALPEQDAIFICAAATPEEDAVLDLVWKYIVPALEDDTQPAARPLISGPIASSFEAPLRVSPRSPLEKTIDGRRIRLRHDLLLSLMHFPVASLPMIVTTKSANLPHQINDIILRFGGTEAKFSWREGPDLNQVLLGLDGGYRENRVRFNGQDFIMLGAGEWIDDSTFTVRLRAIETIECQQLTFTFKLKDRVVMRPQCSPSMQEVAGFLATGAAGFFKAPVVLKWIRRLLKITPFILEAKYSGRLMK